MGREGDCAGRVETVVDHVSGCCSPTRGLFDKETDVHVKGCDWRLRAGMGWDEMGMNFAKLFDGNKTKY